MLSIAPSDQIRSSDSLWNGRSSIEPTTPRTRSATPCSRARPFRTSTKAGNKSRPTTDPFRCCASSSVWAPVPQPKSAAFAIRSRSPRKARALPVSLAQPGPCLSSPACASTRRSIGDGCLLSMLNAFPHAGNKLTAGRLSPAGSMLVESGDLRTCRRDPPYHTGIPCGVSRSGGHPFRNLPACKLRYLR